jgi:hypothetical protein
MARSVLHRHIRVASKDELKARILAYLDGLNREPVIHTWTYNPATGRPFDWEFCRGREVGAIKARGRLVVNDLATTLALCAEGNGIAQTIELGLAPISPAGRWCGCYRIGPRNGFRCVILSVQASAPGRGTGGRGFCCR